MCHICVSKNGPVVSPFTSSFTPTGHNDFPQLSASFFVQSLGLTSHTFMELFLPTPTRQLPPAHCCLPLPAARGSFLAQPHTLLPHMVLRQEGSSEGNSNKRGGKYTPPPPTMKYSHEKSLKHKKTKIPRNC